jgi:hypothetical protein
MQELHSPKLAHSDVPLDEVIIVEKGTLLADDAHATLFRQLPAETSISFHSPSI